MVDAQVYRESRLRLGVELIAAGFLERKKKALFFILKFYNDWIGRFDNGLVKKGALQ